MAWNALCSFIILSSGSKPIERISATSIKVDTGRIIQLRHSLSYSLTGVVEK